MRESAGEGVRCQTVVPTGPARGRACCFVVMIPSRGARRKASQVASRANLPRAQNGVREWVRLGEL